MDLQLAQDIAIVVGGAQGIGLAIAREFAAEGADVALLDRSDQVALASQAIRDQFGVRVLGHVCDATDDASLSSAASWVLEAMGGWHHVVYAAGAGSGKYGFPFWNLTP
ncbi:MAG: SDR family NAD(P)-dependent oxidoreductase, partial [Pirellulaceae bacterium]